MTTFPPVAVFDAHTPGALAFVRSLGLQGVPIHVFSPDRMSVAGSSRFCSARFTCPSLEEPELFIPWLANAFRDGTVGLVAPTSDLLAFYLAEVDALLPAALKRVLPSADAVRTALFKDRFHDAVLAHGGHVPTSATPTTAQDAVEAASRMGFPVVLKPRSHIAAGLLRGTVAHSVEDVAAAFGPVPSTPGNRWALMRHPEQAFPLVQAYVPNALNNLISVSGIIAPDGGGVVAAVSRKLAQWPPALGVGTRFGPFQDPEALEEGVRLAKAILGCGVFEMEFIRDPEGQLLAIDLNPRAHGQVALDIARGNDLPWLWYQHAIHQHVAPTNAPASTGIQWRHGLVFHTGHLTRLIACPNKAQTLAAWRREAAPKAVDIIFRRSDPLPLLPYAARLFRHPGGVIRPFLAPAP